MNKHQVGILSNGPNNGRFIIYSLKANIEKEAVFNCLSKLKINEHIVIGLGKNIINLLSLNVTGYREFPQLNAPINIPATHGDLFVFIKDTEAGKIAIKSLSIKNILSDCFEIHLQVDGFKYLGNNGGYGHDLVGYEDGTENPLDEEALSAVVREDGSCFVALQQWQHDLNVFNSFSQEHKDNTIGRRSSDNAELNDAPESSHVHRTDQASFGIEADILRRSLPWANEHGEGLMFMSFCENLDRFEVQMRRMAGLEDGIIDALFSFSKILNSAYFYCPAIVNESDGMLKL